MNGSLVYQDYLNLIDKNIIIAENIEQNQIQPSSIDLSLSEECYEIKYSFLSYNSKVREKLKNLAIKKIDLSKEFIFRKNKTYVVKLNERLDLQKNVFALGNLGNNYFFFVKIYQKMQKSCKTIGTREFFSRSFGLFSLVFL